MRLHSEERLGTRPCRHVPTWSFFSKAWMALGASTSRRAGILSVPNEVKVNTRAVLLSSKNGVSLKRFNKDYKSLLGELASSGWGGESEFVTGQMAVKWSTPESRNSEKKFSWSKGRLGGRGPLK